MCSLKVSLLSRVTPKSLTVGDKSIVFPPTRIGRRVHFLFLVNITILVFMALILRPLVSHHFSIVFMVRVVLSQITSVSLPSARELRSSANACRYPGISFAVNLSRSSTTRFHRNGESIPPWGHTLTIILEKNRN